MTVEAESDELHGRVQAFAERHDRSFDALATDIARFQARYHSGFRRLVEARGSDLLSADSIPAVPVEAFKLTRVAVHAPSHDAVRFKTSGTSSGAAGVHFMRRTDTYRKLALLTGEQALVSAWPRPRVVVALAPRRMGRSDSSLGFMMRAFMEAWDGRSLDEKATGSFDPLSPERWLLDDDGVDLAGLEQAVRSARHRGEPLVVLATSIALAALVDALGSRKLDAPARTVVMPTGGFKGKAVQIDPSELFARTASVFGIEPSQVVGEYGMTELSSQLYEGTLPGGALSGPRGVYRPPPWLRVTALDPVTHRPLPPGEVGVARFVDLGNVDSAVAILTEDRIRCRDGGIELLGRSRGAPLRGCSLAVEEMVQSAGARISP